MVAQAILSGQLRGMIKDWFTPIEEDQIAADSLIYPRRYIHILYFVPAIYVEDVMDILVERPHSIDQVLTLQRIINTYRDCAEIQLGEVIANAESARLEQYVRIAANLETFEAVKQAIRQDWRESTNEHDRWVFPVILRKVDRV